MSYFTELFKWPEKQKSKDLLNIDLIIPLGDGGTAQLDIKKDVTLTEFADLLHVLLAASIRQTTNSDWKQILKNRKIDRHFKIEAAK